MWNAPTYQEVPTPNYGGMALYPSKQPRLGMTEHEAMLLKRKRVVYMRPLRNTPHVDYLLQIVCYTYFKLIVTDVHTRKLLYRLES